MALPAKSCRPFATLTASSLPTFSSWRAAAARWKTCGLLTKKPSLAPSSPAPFPSSPASAMRPTSPSPISPPTSALPRLPPPPRWSSARARSSTRHLGDFRDKIAQLLRYRLLQSSHRLRDLNLHRAARRLEDALRRKRQHTDDLVAQLADALRGQLQSFERRFDTSLARLAAVDFRARLRAAAVRLEQRAAALEVRIGRALAAKGQLLDKFVAAARGAQPAAPARARLRHLLRLGRQRRASRRSSRGWRRDSRATRARPPRRRSAKARAYRR